jgi:TetR/AcrR family transcriptional regulator, regulator of cefoperazone and chloramphenicol sensitivity
LANVKNNSATQETRRRLLAAAGEVFADRGFHAATIKEITDKADASLAAVNYHFQDKAELYKAVLAKLAEDHSRIVPPDSALSGPAAMRLRQFVSFFCHAAIARQRASWEQVLMAREMAEPTDALDALNEQVLKPLTQKLSAIVAELLDVRPHHTAVGLAAASVLGQCIYYMKHRACIGQMHPQLGDNPDIEQYANHVADFSLTGIRAMRKQLAEQK